MVEKYVAEPFRRQHGGQNRLVIARDAVTRVLDHRVVGGGNCRWATSYLLVKLAAGEP